MFPSEDRRADRSGRGAGLRPRVQREGCPALSVRLRLRVRVPVGEPLFDVFGGSGHDYDLTIVDYGTLHQFRVLGENLRHLTDGPVVGRDQAKGVEAGVIAHEIGWRSVEPACQIGELIAARWGLDIFDDVELDTGLVEQGPNLDRGASPSVVIQREHGRIIQPSTIGRRPQMVGLTPPGRGFRTGEQRPRSRSVQRPPATDTPVGSPWPEAECRPDTNKTVKVLETARALRPASPAR